MTTPMTTPYPLRGFRLIGEDGNAFSILGRFGVAARKAGVPKETIDAVQAEATGGDYNRLLRTVLPWAIDNVAYCDDGEDDGE